MLFHGWHFFPSGWHFCACSLYDIFSLSMALFEKDGTFSILNNNSSLDGIFLLKMAHFLIYLIFLWWSMTLFWNRQNLFIIEQQIFLGWLISTILKQVALFPYWIATLPCMAFFLLLMALFWISLYFFIFIGIFLKKIAPYPYWTANLPCVAFFLLVWYSFAYICTLCIIWCFFIVNCTFL